MVRLEDMVGRLWPLVEPWFAENYGRHLVAIFLREIAAAEDILDIGAGQGTDLEAARQHFPAARLHAIEAYPPYVEMLRSRGIEVTVADVESRGLPFADGSVDVIIANQILEHVKELFFVLHECARALRPDGSLIIGVPNLAAWHNRLLLLLGVQPPVIASQSPHVRGFTCADLAQLIATGSKGALRVEHRAAAGFYPFPPRAARVLAAVMPPLGWSIHLHVRKVADYDDGFLKIAGRFAETNFRVRPAREA